MQNEPQPNQPQQEQQAQNVQAEDPDKLTQEDQEAYQKIVKSLDKMNAKISKAKTKMHEEPEDHKDIKANVRQIAQKLIQSKENSEIITKENLLTDITESFQKVVVDVYSDNQKLKKKIEEMAKIIKEQSNKIYDHINLENTLKKENQNLREELNKLKDERLTVIRNPAAHQQAAKQKDQNATKNKNSATVNNEDYDFWSMPQNDSYGKKKKDIIADSNLWVNQKDIGQSVFLTEERTKKK